MAIFVPRLPRASSGTSRSWWLADERRPRRGRRRPVPLRPPAADGQPDARSLSAGAATRTGRFATSPSRCAPGEGRGAARRERLGQVDAAADDRRVLEPDAGRMVTDGRVGSLLSIQAGVMALLTGPREHPAARRARGHDAGAGARARAAGRARRASSASTSTISSASYSQGMRARLGLAVIERTEPSDPAARRGPRGARPRVPRPRRVATRTSWSAAAGS